MRKVAVVGVGQTKFGNLGEVTTRELFLEASLNALQDANLSSDDIDAIYFGNLDSSRFEHQCHTAAINASLLTSKSIPSTRIENACASGGTAFIYGYLGVASGMFDTVLIAGAEKMTNLTTGEAIDVLATCADDITEVPHGITFPGLYALMARAHMAQYGTTEEQMALVAVKNHKNAMDNPYAQFHKEITLEKALSSIMVADPLKLYDCSPISDGAAAVILMPLDEAIKIEGVTPVEVTGVGQASDIIDLASRRSLTSIHTTKFMSLFLK